MSDYFQVAQLHSRTKHRNIYKEKNIYPTPNRVKFTVLLEINLRKEVQNMYTENGKMLENLTPN